MIHKTPLWVFWLVLLVPALLVAFFGLRLVSHEQDRAARSLERARLSRLQSVADDLSLSVQEVESGLTATLAGLDRSRLPEELAAMRRSNPLIRNAFILASNGTLRLPRPDWPADREEELFVQRYEALFAGRIPWNDSREPATPDAPRSRLSSSAASRRELSELASRPTTDTASPVQTSVPDAGWMPWFSGQQLHLLGWRRLPDRTVYGIELETVALLARLLPIVPAADKEESLTLHDGQGRLLHQAGPVQLGDDPPVARLAIGDTLPHWELRLYIAHGADAAAGGIRLMGGLLVCILVAAIVFGGSMLLWQARRSRLDAMQKTSFVSNVSHELKTPLTTIRMYAEMLGEGRVRDEARRDSYLHTIISESQRLTRLVNNVLDFSRLEQNRRNYTSEPLDLATVIDEVVDMQRERLGSLGITLTLDTEPELTVRTDRDALQQALLNLVDNAAKYAADGREIRVESRAGARGVSVCILDRGPGVPAGERNRIFDKFYRLDASLTTRQPGCGLGLSIARRLMRDQGGDVTYREREGGGAIFCIDLPAAPAVNHEGEPS